MEHFAIFAPPFPSHIRALEALASQLIDFGHAVSWIHQADVKKYITDHRIGFRAVGRASHPYASLQCIHRRAANPGSLSGLRRVISDIADSTDMLCAEGPQVLKSLKVTAIIADQMEAAGGLVAEGLKLPFISVACALPVNREPAVPLPVMPWAYATSQKALELNKTSTRIYDWLMKPHARVISKYSKRFGLPLKLTLADCLSPLAQLSQTTADFDFPRTLLPVYFYHVGPLRGALKTAGALKFAVDARHPFVFASLGTLQGARFHLFMRIALACKSLQLQLLIAHCDHLDGRQEQLLREAGATWVTGFADQQAAVKMADVVVTHGGLNTVLDALAASTPMLVLPVAFDQPGVATRVVHAGAGLKLTPRWATETSIANALDRLIREPGFSQHAERIGQGIALAGGTYQAAQIVLSAIARYPAMTVAPPDRTPLYLDESQAYAT